MIILVFLLLYGNFQPPGVSALHCLQPFVPENGHVIFNEPGPYAPGTIAKYSCALGFERVGAGERTCRRDGQWTGSAPACAIDIVANKPCEQSSGTPSPLSRGVCTITDNESRSWWEVDLLGTYSIHSLSVRLGPQSSPIANIEMELDNGHLEYCVLPTHDYLNTTLSIPCAHQNVAKIRIIGTNRLQLCEMKAFATDAVSYWQCAQGTMEVIGVFDGMCYSASKEEQTDWLGAQRKCLDRGASLPIRMTETSRRGLQSALSAINTRKAFYWIGASSSVSDWRWADGEKISDSADWPSEEPPIPGASEAVLLARPLDWRWVPASQSAWNAFLCQSKPKFCTSPGVGEATKVVFSSHSYAIGTYCFYACEEGYEMEGERQRQCEENGRWSGNIPTCHKKNCGEPEPWTQGTIRILNGSTLYQSEVEYVCFAGYQLLGDSKRVCQADGTWSGATPGCIELDCGRPPNVANGMVFVDSTTFESMANYTCNHGYRLIGPDAIFCGEKSAWEPSAPFCYDISSLREMKPEPGSSSATTSESNILLALLAVLLVSLLVMAVFKFSRPGISGSASINEKYSSNVIYATPSIPTRPDSVVYYAASCQPLAQMEVPPHLLSLQQLPNGNIHVTLPIGRPLVRPALPTFAPVSPTPSQILYSFDHEPIYDIPPDGIEIKKEENYYEHMDNPISRSPMTSASGSQQALLPSCSPMPPPPPIRYFPT